MGLRTSIGAALYLGLASATAVVGLAWPGGARAQELQINAPRGNFGKKALRPGFRRDPHRVNVVSGGTIDVATLGHGAGCVGWATRRPDYVLQLNGESSQLRFFVVGSGDTGLVINGADGAWHCNDDADGTNPVVTLSGAARGHYDIWVTSYQRAEQIRGTLYITELDLGPSHPTPGVASAPAAATNTTTNAATGSAGGLQIGGSSSNFGTATLTAGFTPDPRQIAVTSGGTIDVASRGLGAGCVGWATRQPDYIVRWGGSSSRLRFYFTASGDTGLAVNSGAGRWYCNDDSYGGRNPTVDISSPPAGQYDIWVTSYQSGQQIRGTLHITEMDQHP